jgi:hypothetical protein
LQALVALHGLWALALAPLTVWAARTWQPARLRFLGLALCLAGLTLLVVLVGPEMVSWLSTAPEQIRKYTAQRILYLLGVNVDLPILQIIVAGAACRWAARRRTRLNGIMQSAA